MSTNNLIQSTNSVQNSSNSNNVSGNLLLQQSSSNATTTATHTNVLSSLGASGSGGITFTGGGAQTPGKNNTLGRIVVRKNSGGGANQTNFVYGSNQSGTPAIGLAIQGGSSSSVLHHLVDTPNSSSTIIPSSSSIVVTQPPTHSFVVGGGGGTSSNSSGGSGGNKPQSQINKCLNEKRRREQENIYIEELAELISASIEDMSSLSVKPDKCAILQETVNQIRRIKSTDECSTPGLPASSSSGSSSSSASQVQQGEVSSSTSILANEILCPLVLEALDGFLFVVNGDGTVEFVSDNVTGFINYVPNDLIGKSIYNVIHLADHARFSSSLLPISIASCYTTPQQQQQSTQPPDQDSHSSTQSPAKHQRTFNIRVLTKSDRLDAHLDDPSCNLSAHYENMQITAMLMPPSCSPPPSTSTQDRSLASSQDTRLVCIARRLPPNERAPGLPVEQFTTKLRTDGRIIGLDTSGLSQNWSQFLKKEQIVNTKLLQELAHNADIPKLNTHLLDALKNQSSTSSVYRMNFGEKVVMVQTKSKVFACNPNTEPDFIMATHTIIQNENDSPPPPPPSSLHSAPNTPSDPQTPRQTPTPTTSNTIPSSPMMIVKKQPPTPTSSSNPLTPMMPSPHHHSLHHNDTNNNDNGLMLSATPSPQQQQPNPATSSSFQTLTLQSSTDYEFNLDFWPDLDLDSNFTSEPQTAQQPQPPQQQQHQQQQPQQRTNQPIASPAAPNLAATWGLSNNSPLSTSSNSPFNPPQQEDLQQPLATQPQQQSTSSAPIGSDRLRNLLTLSQQVGAPRNDNKILKKLLNDADEHEDQPNNMLLRLLNNTGAAGGQPTQDEPMRRGTELLQQLLNEDNTSPQPGVKRTFSQMMEEHKWQQPALLPPPPPPPTVKGDLCKRNPRLVSLLQKPSDPPASVPLVPPSYLSLTPQEKMKIRAQQPPQQQQPQQIPPQFQQQQNRNNLLNNLLNNNSPQQPRGTPPSSMGHPPPVSPQLAQAASAARSTPSPQHIPNSPQPHVQQSPLLSGNSIVMNNNPQANATIDSSDAILDEILDQVIDIVPEDIKQSLGGSELAGGSTLLSSGNSNTSGGATLLVGNQNQILGQSTAQSQNFYSDDVSNILNLLESNADIPSTLLNSTPSTSTSLNSPSTPTTPLSAHTPSDMARIDAIQKELMQYETIQQMQQITTIHNQSPSPQPTTPTSINAPMMIQQQLQQPNSMNSTPLLIQRTTTTSTIARFRSPPNQIVPNHQQQLLKQQMLLRQQQQGQHHQQQQRFIHQQGLLQHIQELKSRSGGAGVNTVNIQNLDSLLSGSVPPPNVTLTTNGGGAGTSNAVFERIVGGQVQQVTQQGQGGNTIVGSIVGGGGNLLVQQVQQGQQNQQSQVIGTGGIVIGGANINVASTQNQQQLQQLQQQQLLRLNIQQQQQMHGNAQGQGQYNPITSLTQSNQLNQRIVMNNQATQQWVNQNKARISIQQQNNPMLNAQLGATVVSSGGGASQGITQLQQQLLLRQQQQQNFQQQQQQQQQQFMFNRVRAAGSPGGVQQQVVTNQQLHLLQQQQQLNQLTIQQQQQLGTNSPNQLPQQVMIPQQIVASHSISTGIPSSPIDVRPGLRAVVGARTGLGTQLGVLNIHQSGSSPLVVVSSSTGGQLVGNTNTTSSGVPDLDALGFSSNSGNTGNSSNNGAGGSGNIKVSI